MRAVKRPAKIELETAAVGYFDAVPRNSIEPHHLSENLELEQQETIKMPPPTPLAIKTSSVARLLKEDTSYHKELVSAEKSLDKMLASGTADEYELKQQVG